MLILDTNHLTVLENGGAAASAILLRLDRSGKRVATTIICVDEKLRGWLASIGKARRDADQVRAYTKFQRSVEQLGRGVILPYDEAAAARFQELRKLKLGIGTMDAKIAAIVLVQGGTLLSRNLSDFTLVPGLEVEDWI